MTNIELAVLGLIAEGPRHGYQIAQDIETRGMRAWTEIGFSSIYSTLNKLEHSGWIESQVHEVSGQRGPARKVYGLTPAGMDAHRKAVRQRLSKPHPRSADFLLALANLPVLSDGEQREALLEYQGSLRQQIGGVREKQMRDQQARHLAPHVEALFDYSLTLMTAELEWIDRFLDTKT